MKTNTQKTKEQELIDTLKELKSEIQKLIGLHSISPSSGKIPILMIDETLEQ